MRLVFIVAFATVEATSFVYSTCQTAVQNGTFGTAGVTDRNGEPTSNLSFAEGYEYSYCVKNCGGGYDPNDYTDLSEQATLWFLPWFSLVAQIPYFTKDKPRDILVMFLTLGSPATALYSLFLTIFDRNWLRTYCNRSGTHSDQTLHDISEVLYSLHQFSSEVTPVRGFLAVKDQKWWETLRKWFAGRRRHMEGSGYAQLFLTVAIYIGAVLPDAFADVGGNSPPACC